MRKYRVLLVALFLLISCNGFPHVDASESIPPARFGHRMVYDPVNGRVLLLGGAVWESRYTFFDDLWVLDTAEGDWREILPEAAPPEEQPEEPEQRGIPGFPPASIALGIALFILLLAYMRQRT